MIRRICWPFIGFVLLLYLLAKVQEWDEQAEAREFQQVTQIQRGK